MCILIIWKDCLIGIQFARMKNLGVYTIMLSCHSICQCQNTNYSFKATIRLNSLIKINALQVKMIVINFDKYDHCGLG